MKVINLFGGPGSGKSTTAAGLFYKMKKHGLKVELVSEYAKELVYESRFDILQEDQLYIFAKQHRKIYRLLKQNYDFVITDSPMLLSMVYLDAYIYEQFYSKDIFNEFILSTLKKYDNINFFISRPVEIEYAVEGRVQTEEESEAISNKIITMANKVGEKLIFETLSHNLVDKIFGEIKK